MGAAWTRRVRWGGGRVGGITHLHSPPPALLPGNLWVAQWGGSRVVAYRPSDGSIVCTVMLPAAHVSSCAFGGPTMGDLYITTAKEHLTPEQRAAQPGAGNAFIVRNIGWTGMATNFFRDA